MFLSAAMMLDWLGERHRLPACQLGAQLLTRAVEQTFTDGSRVPFELGGNAGTVEIAAAVTEHVRSEKARARVEREG
jgi:3-isopropylmalate dehydrogenase